MALTLTLTLTAAALISARPAPAQPAMLPMAQPSADDYAAWPRLVNPFPSTGGGGFMIDGYRPVVADGRCTTDFQAISPEGQVFRNTVEFDAVEVAGGILCTHGRWRSLDGDARGTTAFRVFLKDGVWHAAP
jgi:hypothetical protein